MVLVQYFIVDTKTKKIQQKPFHSIRLDYHLHHKKGHKHDPLDKKEDEEIIAQYIHVSDPFSNPIYQQDSQFIHLLNQHHHVLEQLHPHQHLSKKEKLEQLHAFQLLRNHILSSSSSANDDQLIEIEHIIHDLQQP